MIWWNKMGEQSSRKSAIQRRAEPMESGPGASRRVSRGLMQALERRQIVPGQRLIETEIALQYGVGRNAVREAIQWLAAHGVIEVSRHRSAAIRQLDVAEALEVIDVAAAVIGLAANLAARQFRAEAHQQILTQAESELRAACDADAAGATGRARRHFYRMLIELGGNRELHRLFPAIGLPVVHAHYPAGRAARLHPEEFADITRAVACRDPEGAEAAARTHMARMRAAIQAEGARA